MSEWISVKDRLPEDFYHVDVWFKPHSLGIADEWRVPDAYIRNGRWLHIYRGAEAELEGRHITHWMPIPEPPK